GVRLRGARNRPRERRCSTPGLLQSAEVRLARWASPRALEATQLSLDLGPFQVIHLGAHLRSTQKNRCLLAAALANAHDGLGFLVLLVGQQGGDDVDRAGTFSQRLARTAVDLHARENIVGASGRGIVVCGQLCGLSQARGNDRCGDECCRKPRLDTAHTCLHRLLRSAAIPLLSARSTCILVSVGRYASALAN